MFKDYMVVIGCSAGGLTALKGVISRLPADFPAAVIVVKHIQPGSNMLPGLISRFSKLPVITPRPNQTLESGHIFVAPSDCHITIVDGKIHLDSGPKINHARPAIDPLFCSAALYNGPATIGVVLSGMLDDGSTGLAVIKEKNGIAIAQDLSEAEYPDMPKNAIQNVAMDYCLPVNEIALVLEKLVQKPLEKLPNNTNDILITKECRLNKVNRRDKAADLRKIAQPSPYGCPDCGGVLWKIDDSPERYRCRVGHAYGIDSLLNGMEESIEEALWAALCALEEKEQLAMNIADKAARENSGNTSYFKNKAEQVQRHVKVIKTILNEKIN
ncbi:Chemotaxis response regulator protein-glutamate methylesterase [Legionella quinlivanii]|uniref:protein-glutamate methylesterase n=1 Tax=Legionella quinlivanii TaxID=45073 RepID=A0A0W0Y5S1_9GAMM|nr:chemotaxis protein CheB [Legionella quinlivanii]KTD52080.1 Chemotaxis response regulator protein-glutamate methylesterase [Legionella quinlivanii]MCW8452344.1 chemotaxis protein CheB [Legionella quinlivanii]SEF89553.1 two-component system, chemotaxis family, response regulator CheB [Legionella quinlivanii DSM 21216]STY12424.1 fused chemotaxis regulator; protein-glutamat [Legionella quinlivanii]